MAPRTTTAPAPPTAPAKPVTAKLVPTWEHELELHAAGFSRIAGVDEAGRGAWAGPLVAAAVILPHPASFDPGACSSELAEQLSRLRESKMLTARVREEMLDCINPVALAVGVGIVSPGLIDVIGVGPANRLAMVRAVRDLGIRPSFLLLDAFRLPSMPIPQRPIIKGDATCMSIAAASVVAKVTRDRMMDELGTVHSDYGFGRHKGYGTDLHVEALLCLGVCPIHRRSYAPIKAIAAGLPWPPPIVSDPIGGEE